MLSKVVHPGFISHVTHGHLIKHNEVLPGLSKSTFLNRRLNLVYGFGPNKDSPIKERKHPLVPEDNAIVVLLGSKTRYSSENIFYPFQQNSNYSYLTGISEPDSCSLLIKKKNDYKFIGFLNIRNSSDVMWEGPGIGIEKAVTHFGCHEAYSNSKFFDIFKKEVKSFNGTNFSIYYDFFNSSYESSAKSAYYYPKHLSSSNEAPWSDLENFISSFICNSFKPLEPLIHRLRLVKCEEEINLMRKAGQIAAEGFKETIKNVTKFNYEKDIWAYFKYITHQLGADDLAYVPVIAGSPSNSCIVHYTKNDMAIDKDSLILMDAGVIYRGYCSDITKTFAASGKMTKKQQDLYDRMFEVQKSCIKLCKPGVTLTELLYQSIAMIKESICKDLFKLNEFDSNLVVQELYPHHVSHWLGMDVHDCAKASDGCLNVDTLWYRDLVLENMVLTVEPGIYIPPEVSDNSSLRLIPPQYRGISIRIEDDVLVSSSGKPEVLTQL